MKYFLLIAIAFITLNSCTKQSGYNSENVSVAFDVEQQINVSSYVIQTSADGKTFTDRIAVKADNSQLSKTYHASFYQAGKGYIYLRIKSVDLDNSADYSAIQRFVL